MNGRAKVNYYEKFDFEAQVSRKIELIRSGEMTYDSVATELLRLAFNRALTPELRDYFLQERVAIRTALRPIK